MAQDYGWAYVKGAMVTGAAGTIGSLQFRGDGDSFGGSDQLIYDYANTSLILSGNLNVSGSVSANQFNLDVTNKTVINLTATGSTKFGDTSDDTHEVTGSIRLAGSMSSSAAISASIFYGSAAGMTDFPAGAGGSGAVATYSNSGNNRIITSVNSNTINSEANLTFDGNLLTVTGEISSSISLSSSIGQFTHLTGSLVRFGSLTDGTATMTGGSISSLNQISAVGLTGSIATAAQPNITSLGNLTTLTVDSTTFVVNESTNRVGIGRAGPERTLDVLDASNPQLRLTYTASPAKHVDFQSTAQGYLYLDPSGDRVGINTSSPTAELAVTGAAHISGNVGIYTKTPEEALDVRGNARITGNLYVSGTLSARVTDFQVSADTLTFGDASGDAITINASTVAVPNNLNFDSNTLFIDSSNNRIGIGTNSPDYTLDIAGNIGVNEYIYHNGDANTYIRFQDDDINIQVGGKSMIKIDEDTNSKILLNKSGQNVKVGIGTDTPEADLHVSGAVVITNSLAVTGSITGSIFTNETVTISGSTVSGVGTLTATTVTATNLGGTLSTAAQANITSVGNLTGLTVDSTTFVVNGTTNKVAIGRAAADKKLEIVDATAAQLRLTYTASPAKYADLHANSTGDLVLQPASENVGIGTSKPNANLAVSGTLHVSASSLPMKIQGLALATATTSSFLALDSNNNLILTSSGGVEYINASVTNYTNPSNNRILTSVNADSVNAEANLTFDGTTVALTGQLSASVGLSSSLGQFTELTGSKGRFTTLTDGTISITGGQLSNASLLSTANISTTNITSSHAMFTNIKGTLETAAQPNITSVGNLTSLTADSTTLVVKSTTSRVGIGRAGPQKKLEVLDSSAAQLRLTHTADSKQTDFQTTSDGYLYITASGGRVGIGSSSPNASLDVAGGAIFNNLGADNDFRVESVTNQHMFFVDAGTDRVGINSSAPQKDLHIQRASGETTLRLQSAGYYSDIMQSGANLFIQNAAGAGNIIFYDDSAERMRIDTDGDVGIGTASPTARLHIKSSGNSTYPLYIEASDGSNLGGMFQGGSGNGSFYVRDADGNAKAILQSLGVSSFLGGGIDTVGDITTTGGAISGSGNLLISGQVTASTMNLTGLSAGTATTSSYLALDSNYNVVLTSSSGGGAGSVSIANDADNRIVTAVGNGTINGEANLTFDGSRLLANSGLIHKRTTAATNYTVLINDYYIGVSPTASLTIQLPNASTLTSGQTYTIKDESGLAEANKITVQAAAGQTIDGELSVQLESNYAAINLYTNGTDKYFIF